MNIDELQNASKKDLADQAKSLGIAGFGAMVKDDLIKAIARAMKKKAKEREKAKAAKMKSVPAPIPSLNGKHHTNGKPSGTTPAVLATLRDAVAAVAHLSGEWWAIRSPLVGGVRSSGTGV